MSPKVSIIVPIYNTEDYLDECVRSLLAQTLRDIEVILVDDGSTDACRKIVDRYAAQDSRVVAIHKSNGGQSSARNIGMRRARGEYLLFVDSDDWIVPETCEALYKEAQGGECDCVHGDLYNEKERIEQDPSFRRGSVEGKVVSCGDYLHDTLVHKTYDIVPFLNLLKKQYLLDNELTFHEGKFYEDQEFTLKLYTARDGCGTVKKIRFPFYYYRDNPNSTTNVTTLRKFKDLFDIYLSMYRYVEALGRENKQLLSDAKTVINLTYYQVGRVWAHLPSESLGGALGHMRGEWGKRLRGVIWPSIDVRFKMQNIMFTFFPRFERLFIRKWESR